ncbi:unnamed protein product [Ilex paraguariensis]|uniref:Uncharacterized protein n=1 Tax=Ilex paraguariensis TaxID=185542 RepID=A0ABC8TE40_9AQUA
MAHLDRRQSKRPLPYDASQQEKEADPIFPLYASAQAQQDNSAMVSALAHVLGAGDSAPSHRQGNYQQFIVTESAMKDHNPLPHTKDQGKTQ